MKTSKLTGPALDWAVSKALGLKLDIVGGVPVMGLAHNKVYAPSTDWEQGGPIIERKGTNISVDYQDETLFIDLIPLEWRANLWNNSVPGTSGFLLWAYGPTPLIAAMRCLVASKLGDEIEIPKELI